MASLHRRTFKKVVDGKVVKTKSKIWYIKYRDAAGKQKRIPGYVDKEATRQKAARLAVALAKGAEGLVDRFEDSKRKPITAHLVDYLDDLRSLGRDPMYVYVAEKRLKVLFADCKWTLLGEVESNRFMKWRDRRQTGGHPRGRGNTKGPASAKTLNDFLNTLKAFLNWCVKHDRLEANPLAKVEKVTGEAKRKRRALADAEFEKILSVAPAERRLPWELLLVTGLRVQEAIDLEWQDVHVDAIKPWLSLRASAVKSRRDQQVPLRQDVAAKLRAVRPAGANPSARVFASFPTLEDWKADLAAAGIDYKDGAGRQADRHAIRTTMGTRLQRAGVPIRVAMELMRHSDMRLTTKVYTDPTAFDLSGAIEALPALRPSAEPKTPEKGVSG